MKFFHISDLHIGKTLHLYDMKQQQRDVFSQIIEYAKEQRPDAILIAGDIYDKSAPSGEAFDLFNELLNEFAAIEPAIPVLIISGNHDSNLRLNYASSFLEKNQIYIAAGLPQSQDEYLKKVVLEDAWGNVNFYLLPFTKPIDAKNLFGEECEVKTYDEAVAAMLQREKIDYTQRNVLLSHQFYIASGKEPDRRDSEMRYISVGGIDSVDVSHVSKFDYVALGHIHTSQRIGAEHIRYSGTPLKYSVSEATDEKSITVVELSQKGDLKIDFLPLVMKRDIKKLRGSLAEILAMASDSLKEDYVSITLTDEEVLFRPKDRLQEFYDYIIEILIDNTRVNTVLKAHEAQEEIDDPYLLFREFYQEMNGQPMSQKEEEIINRVIDNVIAANNE